MEDLQQNLVWDGFLVYWRHCPISQKTAAWCNAAGSPIHCSRSTSKFDSIMSWSKFAWPIYMLPYRLPYYRQILQGKVAKEKPYLVILVRNPDVLNTLQYLCRTWQADGWYSLNSDDCYGSVLNKELQSSSLRRAYSFWAPLHSASTCISAPQCSTESSIQRSRCLLSQKSPLFDKLFRAPSVKNCRLRLLEYWQGAMLTPIFQIFELTQKSSCWNGARIIQVGV